LLGSIDAEEDDDDVDDDEEELVLSSCSRELGKGLGPVPWCLPSKIKKPSITCSGRLNTVAGSKNFCGAPCIMNVLGAKYKAHSR